MDKALNENHRTLIIMYSNQLSAKAFGVFLILSFVSYGLGSGLVDSVIQVSDGPINIQPYKTKIIFGIILITIVHTILNIGLISTMFSIIKLIKPPLAYGYLIASITATLLLAMGAIFLWLLLPLSDGFMLQGKNQLPYFQPISVLLQKINFLSYQIGMAIWGFGGLMLCCVFYISQIVPRFFSIWGFFGYLIFIAGTVLELYEYEIGVYLSIPGGLFEISIALWLIFKGFDSLNNHENTVVY